jgi:hypothetical protein
VKLHCLAGVKVFVHIAVELKSIPVHIMVLWGLYSVTMQLYVVSSVFGGESLQIYMLTIDVVCIESIREYLVVPLTMMHLGVCV